VETGVVLAEAAAETAAPPAEEEEEEEEEEKVHSSGVPQSSVAVAQRARVAEHTLRRSRAGPHTPWQDDCQRPPGRVRACLFRSFFYKQ